MRVAFGEYVLDVAARQLLRGGKPVHLSNKAFLLLETLVRERPRAFSKADLQARLWPDSFVQESNLASLVREIRRALGEHATRSGWIRTVHAFGYAFAAEAAPDEDAILCRLSWTGGQVGLGEGAHEIGRDPGAAARIQAPTVSWRHARLRVVRSAEGPRAFVEDLASRNGTCVNGLKIGTECPVQDGDEIRLGSVVITVQMVGAAPRSPTEPLVDIE